MPWNSYYCQPETWSHSYTHSKQITSWCHLSGKRRCWPTGTYSLSGCSCSILGHLPRLHPFHPIHPSCFSTLVSAINSKVYKQLQDAKVDCDCSSDCFHFILLWFASLIHFIHILTLKCFLFFIDFHLIYLIYYLNEYLLINHNLNFNLHSSFYKKEYNYCLGN